MKQRKEIAAAEHERSFLQIRIFTEGAVRSKNAAGAAFLQYFLRSQIFRGISDAE